MVRGNEAGRERRRKGIGWISVKGIQTEHNRGSTQHKQYLDADPKDGVGDPDPDGPTSPPRIKFGDDVAEEIKNGISVSVLAYTEREVNIDSVTATGRGDGALFPELSFFKTEFGELSCVVFDFSEISIFFTFFGLFSRTPETVFLSSGSVILIDFFERTLLLA